jgi:cystathionine gamma-synthase
VVTFELPRNEEETAAVVDRLKIPYMASNFGAPQTLIEQSTLFTYYEYSDEELERIGVTRGTVRLSLGYIDDVQAVIADLKAALEA